MAMVDHKTDTLSLGGGGGRSRNRRPSNPISVPNGQGGYTRPRPNQSNSGNGGLRCDRNNDGDCYDEAVNVLNTVGGITGGAAVGAVRVPLPGAQAVAVGLAATSAAAFTGGAIASAFDDGHIG